MFRSAWPPGRAPRRVRGPAASAATSSTSATSGGQPGRDRRDRRHAPGWRAYNVASGAPATVLEIGRALARAMDGPAPVVTGEFRSAT
jgi:dTDP-L-rhamnose 4-epimerase